VITKLLSAALVASFSVAAHADSLDKTHEQVSMTGKTVVAYRPIERSAPIAGKCHPDATKAVACEARLQMQRAEALAANEKREAVRLSQN